MLKSVYNSTGPYFFVLEENRSKLFSRKKVQSHWVIFYISNPVFQIRNDIKKINLEISK